MLLISFALLFIRFARYNLWNRDDTRWMGAIRRVLANDEDHVPDVGRYNAGQKLVFWGMTLLILVLFASGIVIWDTYFFTYTAIWQKRIAQLVHSVAAVGIIGIWIVHVYAALWVRGTVQAIGAAKRAPTPAFRGVSSASQPSSDGARSPRLTADPCRHIPLPSPRGAPGEAPPCILHFPFAIRIPRHRPPLRVRAPHRGQACAKSRPTAGRRRPHQAAPIRCRPRRIGRIMRPDHRGSDDTPAGDHRAAPRQ